MLKMVVKRKVGPEAASWLPGSRGVRSGTTHLQPPGPD